MTTTFTSRDCAPALPPSTPEKRSWDFSNVYNLINSLSPAPDASKPAQQTTPPQQPLNDVDFGADKNDASSGLGDFNKLWQFLGTPGNAPPPAFTTLTPPGSESETLVDTDRLAYASDGAAYHSSSKGVKWGVQEPIDDLADESDVYQELEPATITVAPIDSTLTKTQRKREARKARKRAEAENSPEKNKAASGFESNDDAHLKHAPARNASIHTLGQADQPAKEPALRYNLRSQKTPMTPQPAKRTKDVLHPMEAPHTAPKMLPLSLCPSGVTSKSRDVSAISSKKLEDSAIPFDLAANQPSKKGKSKNTKQESWTSTSPPKRATPGRYPSGAPSGLDSGYYDAILNNTLLFPANSKSPIPAPPSPEYSGTFVVRDKDDRNLHFFLSLVQQFPEDKHWLAKPAQLVNHTESPTGIHVFIDFSNIHIGFQNRVKTMRGLPVQARIRREDIDFDAFVLLMERRRPVAKRVLVGSLPAIPAFEKARAIGYETSVLDKVYKARELTDRQKYFRQRDAEQMQQYRRRNGGTTTSGEGSGSGSETGNAVTHAKEAWVEQGVDEILHLKMLESIVDVDEPTTMVLATGDAAAAEYSQGFMRMVERALKKGWRIELVSWKAGISSQYMKRDFRQKWGDRFRVSELDDWVEDLLDT